MVTDPLGTGRTATLVAEMSAVLTDVRQRLGAPADQTAARLQAMLGQPLTLAVAGRTNAGKSTLVNALIGTGIAPTRATECTRVVTWFRFGPGQSHVVCTDGTRIPLWLTEEGRLPDELPVAAEKVARVEVSLDYEPLRAVTVIDTPGLSGDEGLADQTEQLLAHGHADALLFVFGLTVRDDERSIVADFRRRDRALYDFPGNAHGVVSRADTFASPEGPWAEAQSVSAAHARALGTELAGVLPVMGKIAETTETGAFTEKHASWLRTIAALPADERDRVLRYAKAFARAEILTPAQRSALLERLDIYGVRKLTTPVHAHSSAAAMSDALRDASGIAALQERINVLFVRPAPVHKAVRALVSLERAVRATPAPDHIRDSVLDRIQTVRDSPAMHILAELKALTALYSGRCELADTTAAGRARRLFEKTDPAARLDCAEEEILSAATSSVQYWKSMANHAVDPLVTLVAETAATSANLLRTSFRSRR